jgi:hypothetical protein
MTVGLVAHVLQVNKALFWTQVSTLESWSALCLAVQGLVLMYDAMLF